MSFPVVFESAWQKKLFEQACIQCASIMLKHFCLSCEVVLKQVRCILSLDGTFCTSVTGVCPSLLEDIMLLQYCIAGHNALAILYCRFRGSLSKLLC